MIVRTFSIIPASTATFATLAGICLFLLAAFGFFVFIGYSATHISLEISNQGLRIKGLYGRFIPRENILKDEVKIINLNTQPEYKPRLRTNGIGLPGYEAGWFKLRNNEKALLFVTDYSRVVYIPTDQGYSVLLSVSNTEDFRQSLVYAQ
jgi:hypothetical protein